MDRSLRFVSRHTHTRTRPLLTLLLLLVLGGSVPATAQPAGGETSPASADPAPRFPNVLLVTIDTLRLDRLSGYGYERPTTPHLDRLMAAGARFDQARCVEPLTAPSLISTLTSIQNGKQKQERSGTSHTSGETT